MPQSSALLSSGAVLWLKILLSAATLVLLYLRYERGRTPGASSSGHSFRKKAIVASAIVFSAAVFHNVGGIRGGAFVQYGDMFHYYLGPKYFKELNYYELYNATIIADSEQDNTLVGIPFYTDLRTYRNAPREAALDDIDRVKRPFSKERWAAFKDDVSFFKTATGMPRLEGLRALVRDHGYNPSPTWTFVLNIITNIIPVTQVWLLAVLDVLLAGAMFGLVFRTFGFEMGALFSIYFYANVLNDHESISGCLLRFDWLFCIVAAVCLLKKERYASSAFFLTLSAMIRLFPAALFVGLAVSFFQKVRLARAVDGKIKRFIVAAGATALLLFLLPATSLGSLKPWNDFFSKMELHDSGVYVNHVGLRGIVLFEPSHLSLERFVETYTSPNHSDLVRHWQEVKQMELRDKRFITTFFSLVVLGCVVAIIWKRKEGASESVIWPVLLIYVMSYPSAYYYIFLCLFVLLFFGRADPLGAFVPLGLLLVFNITALVTKYFEPSPIVFYTLVNIYLFICLLSILCFEMYTNVFRKTPLEAAAVPYPPHEPSRGVKRRRRQGRASRK